MAGEKRFNFLPVLCVGLATAAVLCLGLTLDGDPLGLKAVGRFLARRSPFTVNKEGSKPHIYAHAAVAADSKICSDVGVDILKKGGNAVDAAISTVLCTGVVNCHSAGIGGGGFMLVYDRKTGRSDAIDFRETAPASMSLTTVESLNALKMYGRLNGESLGIGIPGELRGLEMASNKYGKLPWKELFKPVIKIAKEGFFIHHALARAIKRENMTIFDNQGLKALFYNSATKSFLKEGDVLKRPKLAKTLKIIAKEGAKAFYNGSLTATIVKDIQTEGGAITKKDLNEYKAISRKVIKTDLYGYKALVFPPPSGGAILAESLKLLSMYHLKPEDLQRDPVLIYHRIIEAFKFAHAKDALLGDPKFIPNSGKVVKSMLDPSTIKHAFNAISSNGTLHSLRDYGDVNKERSHTTGTTHLSIIDKDGNAVALTSSINKYFGSKIRSRDLGIIYNDQVQDALNYWNLMKAVPEYIQPGRRPYSASSPTIMLEKNGDVSMAIGAAGGDFIPTSLTQTIMNYLWFNMSLTDAINQPRVHAQLHPPLVLTEPTFNTDYSKQLSMLGHNVTTNTTLLTGAPYDIMGVVQVVTRKDGKLYAECDSRKGGIPAGY